MADDKITWSPDAENAVKHVPFFVRGRAKQAAEDFAREQGQTVVTVEMFTAAMDKIVPPGMRRGGPPGGPPSGA